MSEREELRLQKWDDVLAQLETIQAKGIQQLGAWDASQCCGHLNQWLSFPMDGFPDPGLMMKPVLWLMKQTVGKSQLNSIIQDGFKPGVPTLPATVPEPNAQAVDLAVAELKATIQRFRAYTGPIHASPLFGAMTKETAEQLQFRHFEHHLSFFRATET